MSNVLETSVSGLIAFQNALTVTSNNISNVDTPGYSEEGAILTAQTGTRTSAGDYGDGVLVSGVARNYSELLATQMRNSQSGYSGYNAFATTAATIDNMLSDTTTGLTATLQSFSNSLQTLASDPTSTASATAVLSSAQGLSQTIQGYASQLQDADQDVEGQISSNVTEINTLASSIANLNSEIASQSGSGQNANSLLDQRDEALDTLSQYTSVSTATQSDGSVNVFIGGGQALVTGGTAASLATIPNQYNATQLDVGLTTTGSTVDITNSISGGSLGGLLSVRSQLIDPTLNTLGQISLGVANVMNTQQAAGLTQTGAQGTAMFSVGSVQVAGSATNTGSATVSATVSSVSAVTADNYRLLNTGGSWQLYDESSGQQVTMTGAGTAGSPFTAAGLSIIIGGGTAASGDSYQISPTADAAAGMSVLLTSSNQIASGAAVQTAAASANTGTGTIAAATVTDPTDSALLASTSIVFSSPTTYQINGTGTTYPYTAGAAISVNGWTTSISGAPASGDTFTVSSNAGNTGDDSNLLAMISGLSSSTLNNGSSSLLGAANALVTQVGAQTQQAQSNASAQQAINTSATDSVNSESGVNLDEEAANMVKYQQAYQACAQMIQTSTTMFNSLITALSTT